jgi:hypothetical protein
MEVRQTRTVVEVGRSSTSGGPFNLDDGRLRFDARLRVKIEEASRSRRPSFWHAEATFWRTKATRNGNGSQFCQTPAQLRRVYADVHVREGLLGFGQFEDRVWDFTTSRGRNMLVRSIH